MSTSNDSARLELRDIIPHRAVHFFIVFTKARGKTHLETCIAQKAGNDRGRGQVNRRAGARVVRGEHCALHVLVVNHFANRIDARCRDAERDEKINTGLRGLRARDFRNRVV